MTHDKIIDRIQKLFALAGNNPNDNEAQSAALKAQELMAQYNIEQAQLTGQTEIQYILAVATYPNKKRKSWHKPLGCIIAKNFRCEVILMGGENIAFFGQKADAEAAKATFEFLYKMIARESNRIYNETRANNGNQNGECRSYTQGFLAGLQQKFNEQCTALMIVTPPEVTEKFHDQFQNLRKAPGKQRSVTDTQTFLRGVQDGRSALGKRQITA